MPSRFVWIGIITGIFFVGFIAGIGYLEGSMNIDNMSMQNQPSMMSGLNLRQQMMDDPQTMIQVITVMVNDPDLQPIMMETMMKYPKQMQKLIMINMQDSDQMTMMEDMMADMMERMKTDPELEEAMMEHMDRMKSSKEKMMDSMMNQKMK